MTIHITGGTADDTAEIQAAIADYETVVLPSGTCRVSSLDLTNRIGVTIKGQGILGTQIIPIQSGVNVIDNTGSSNTTLRDFRICGFCNPSIVPTTGILGAQRQGAYTSDVLSIERLRVDGNFSVAALYVYGVASSNIFASQFYNYQPNAITAIFTGNNFFGAASAFATIEPNPLYMPTDWTVVQTEFHNFGSGWAVWLGGARSLRFYGGNMSSGHPVLSVNAVMGQAGQMNPAYIIADGVTFYGDEITHVTPACAVKGMTGAITFRANESPVPLTGC